MRSARSPLEPLPVAQTPPDAAPEAARFVPLLRFHVEQLTPQPRQRSALLLKSGGYGDELDELVARSPRAEAMLIEGRPVAAAGLIDMRHGRGARAWALLGADIPPRALVLMRQRMRTVIAEALGPQGWAHRVEAETPLDWSGGHVLLLGLGFAFEAALAGTQPDGGHSALYVRLSSKVKHLPTRYSAVMQIATRVIYQDVVAPHTPAKPACGGV